MTAISDFLPTTAAGGGFLLKQEVIIVSGTWNKPAGMIGTQVWITMIGGGSSGRFISPNAAGEWGGQFVIRKPVDIGVSTSVSVTIGAGGATAASGTAFNPGSPTSFGAFATASGGAENGDGATGGYGAAGTPYNNGKDTPLGYSGVCLFASAGQATGGGGLILDLSGIGASNQAGVFTRALGYGAGGAGYSISPFGRPGVQGAILVEWLEAV